MKFTSLSVVSAALITGSLACGAGDNEYNSVSNFGGPHQCLPNGYTSMEDRGQLTQAQLQTQCSAKCGSLGTSCQFWFGQLQCAPNGLCTGQCFYFPTVPAAPATCADYPTVVMGQAKDNTNKCFASSASVATPYCSSYLGLGTVTSYTSTYTPISSITTTVATVTTSVCPPPPSKRKRTNKERRVIAPVEVTAAAPVADLAKRTAQITAAPVADLVKRDAASPPACLTTNSIPASRISSACSCLSITSTTLYTVSTAPTSTTIIPTTYTSTSTRPMYTVFNMQAQVTGTSLPVGDPGLLVGQGPLTIRLSGNPVEGLQFYIHSGTIHFLYLGHYDKSLGIYKPGFYTTDDQGALGFNYYDPTEPLTCSIASDNKVTCTGATHGPVTFKTMSYQQPRNSYQLVGVRPEATGDDITLYATNVVPGCYS